MKRNSKGRFTKKVGPVVVTDQEFIIQVKNEIYQLHMDPEHIKKAYKLITGLDHGNIALMRRTIMGYAGN